MRLPRFLVTAIVSSGLLAAARAQDASPSPAATPSVPPAPVAAPSAKAGDAGTLITKEEVAAVQGCAVTDSYGHVVAAEPFRVTQCFFNAAESSKSVVIVVMQTNPADPKKRSIRDFWEGIFSHFDKEEDDKDEKKPEAANPKHGDPAPQAEDEEEEKRKHPPRRITELGDEAFWTRSHVNGTLFVVKGETMLRISVGGSEDDEKQIVKCRALAEKALARLQP